MSIISTLTDTLLGFSRSSRVIAQFKPSVVTEESASDSVEIASHPIEDGSLISDHVIKQPLLVTMECYFTLDSLFGDSPREVYEKILKVHEGAKPFDVTLGKRTLENMLFKTIKYTANPEVQYELQLYLEMQQVHIVGLGAVQVSALGAAVNSGIKKAQAAAGTAADAAKSAAARNTSGLYDITRGLF